MSRERFSRILPNSLTSKGIRAHFCRWSPLDSNQEPDHQHRPRHRGWCCARVDPAGPGRGERSRSPRPRHRPGVGAPARGRRRRRRLHAGDRDRSGHRDPDRRRRRTLVSEFAVWELAAALGLSIESGRNLVAQALELAHRLPKTWARVQAGSLAPWRAKRIADATLHLNQEAAGFVDAQVAPFAHKTGPTQSQRLVDQAIAMFMPELAAEQRDRSAEQRYFTIDHDQVSFAGTSRVHGELDLADAIDLDDAVRRGAEQLAALGNEESLDVRRSLAVGMLARGQQAIEFEAGVVSAGSTTPLGGSTSPKARDVVLYVHLSEDALRSGDHNAPAWLENAGGHLVTAGQVAEWCGVSAGSTTGNGSTTRNGSTTGTTKITVRPVLDLAETLQSAGYQPSPTLTEQIELRDRTCVFPWCNRPARG
ncbi:DUF222 domain-containing protein, partial [Nocardioides pocheonensis]